MNEITERANQEDYEIADDLKAAFAIENYLQIPLIEKAEVSIVLSIPKAYTPNLERALLGMVEIALRHDVTEDEILATFNVQTRTSRQETNEPG